MKTNHWAHQHKQRLEATEIERGNLKIILHSIKSLLLNYPQHLEHADPFTDKAQQLELSALPRTVEDLCKLLSQEANKRLEYHKRQQALEQEIERLKTALASAQKDLSTASLKHGVRSSQMPEYVVSWTTPCGLCKVNPLTGQHEVQVNHHRRVFSNYDQMRQFWRPGDTVTRNGQIICSPVQAPIAAARRTDVFEDYKGPEKGAKFCPSCGNETTVFYEETCRDCYQEKIQAKSFRESSDFDLERWDTSVD